MRLQDMENDLMNAPVDLASPNSVIVAGFPIFSTSRESECSTFTGVANHIVNQLGLSESSGNAEFQDQLAGGVPITVFQSPVSSFHENTKNSAFADPQFQELETFRTCVLHSSANASNSPLASSLYCEGDVALCNRWVQQLPMENAEVENLDQNGWMPSNTMNSKLWNELSLSLATSQPVIIRGTNFLDQYSGMTLSGVSQPALNGTELGSNLNSCNSRDLSLSYKSGSPVHLSRAIVGSRYLSAIQDILSQIASFSLEDPVSHSTTTVGFVSSQFDSQDIDRSDSQTESIGEKLSADAKKSHLLNLLQLIDDRYTQCLDEIHTVVSAFHAATDLDPRLHTHYGLQTITSVYRILREKITNCIFAMGVHSNSMCSKENDESFEASFIQKQWALQQLKKKDNQLWKPQRGLPERSVSVLRAWMFQNFLHPYPKDTEKHLLAVKSGLTRNQVSNWFINARVRLWKPMIEEMYAEMNRRQSSRNEEVFERIRQNQISISSEKTLREPIT